MTNAERFAQARDIARKQIEIKHKMEDLRAEFMNYEREIDALVGHLPMIDEALLSLMMRAAIP